MRIASGLNERTRAMEAVTSPQPTYFVGLMLDPERTRLLSLACFFDSINGYGTDEWPERGVGTPRHSWTSRRRRFSFPWDK